MIARKLRDKARAIAAHLLEASEDDLEWERGKAWAFQQAMGLVWYYHQTNPTMAALGRRTLTRLRSAG